MVGASRRRSLLLFHATDLVRSAMLSSSSPSGGVTAAMGAVGGGGGPAAASELFRGELLRLRLALRGLDPPDYLGTQVRRHMVVTWGSTRSVQ